jgi:hypothetical protein
MTVWLGFGRWGFFVQPVETSRRLEARSRAVRRRTFFMRSIGREAIGQ